MWELACLAQKNAVAEYSGYRVGAALGSQLIAIQGANIEIVVNSLSVCAERSALFSALSQGHRKFTDVVVVVDNPSGATPCGACRQALLDFCQPDLNIWVGSQQGVFAHYTLGQLVPFSFSALDVEAVVHSKRD